MVASGNAAHVGSTCGWTGGGVHVGEAQAFRIGVPHQPPVPQTAHGNIQGAPPGLLVVLQALIPCRQGGTQ